MRCVTIAGGGIAGLALGIFLRERDIPVRVIEAGQYPRHRVCGEYISGRGLEVLKRFGLFEWLMRNGAREARTICFLANGRPVRRWNSPVPALAISRWELDELLARRFEEGGGELRTGQRWTESFRTEGVVRATGRRISGKGGCRWMGIKAHALRSEPGADLEMHFAREGYAGVSRLTGGRVNVCALLRRERAWPRLDQEWPGLLEELTGWRNVEWERGSFAAVAGFSFEGARICEGECNLGDAMGMIPPLTGNGMSIALESAELATKPLEAYSKGEMGWVDACRQVKASSHSQFLERLRWAGMVQKVVFTGPGQKLLKSLVSHCEWVVPLLFARTR